LFARAPKDGYTLGHDDRFAHNDPGFDDQTFNYDSIKDFTPISMMAVGRRVIVAHPSLAQTI
jgi:tripartite-type tricarboxylate transporter receptor subunit TctC